MKRPVERLKREEKPLNKIAMEEKKEKKLSYEELSERFGQLYAQYQKLMAQYRKAAEELDDKSFGYASTYLTLMFKVMEHPDMYSEEFVKWCAFHIEKMLRDAVKSTSEQEEESDEA